MWSRRRSPSLACPCFAVPLWAPGASVGEELTGMWAGVGAVRTVRPVREPTTLLPAADLDDMTWTITHIAALMHIRESAAKSLAHRDGFPAPLCGDACYGGGWPPT